MSAKFKLLKSLHRAAYSSTATNTRLMSTSPVVRHQAAAQVNTQLSYMAGPTGPQVPALLDLTIGQTVERGADLFGDREGLVDLGQNQRRTFNQLRQEINSLAAGFVELGLEQGARIGIWGPSTIEWYLTQFAAARAGLVLVNINPAYQPEELKYCINKVGISAIVCHDKFKSQDYYRLIQRIAPELGASSTLSSSSVPTLKHIIVISDELSHQQKAGAHSFSDILRNAGSEAHSKLDSMQVSPLSAANIQFTSGTTGSPKGVVLSHYNLVNNSMQLGHRLGYDTKEHRICLSVPMHHCFGNVAGTICGMMHGATVVVPAPSFNGAACADAIETEKCTSLYGTPTMFIDILDNIRKTQPNLDSLETGIMAGAPCPRELCRNVMAEMNMDNLCVAYGLTETSTAVTQGFASDSLDQMTGTVGFPTNHMEVRVVDEQGEVVPVGVPGELCSRGFSTMLGYWGDEEKTRETITADGWIRSGDRAVMDANGYVSIVGRIKDMIIRGGENIYPREIEEFLHTHPAVQEAQVFGVADDRMGEEVAVWLKLNSGYELDEADIKSFCKGKLAHFKIPRYVDFVDSFPLTATGKIQKFNLKAIMEERLAMENRIAVEKAKLEKTVVGYEEVREEEYLPFAYDFLPVVAAN
eukprot:TRINITY_DN1753_c0_g1_i2.p1 TRINITY_DN1753_c0_g1~~TRINITY_DN1753_c0_g1_i2.p1  ORF type:complete len:641 (+),score=202.54 TRINITY_DN1753_c0_g1_i2:63-1985(+)